MNRLRTVPPHPALTLAKLSHELADLPRRTREREFVKVADELWLPSTADRDLGTLSVAYSRLYPAGVLTGWSAASFYGVAPEYGARPELSVGPHGRARRGLVLRRYSMPPDEVRVVRGVRVTSPLWTAFDLARFNSHLIGVIAVAKFYRRDLSRAALGRKLDALAGTWGVARARRVFADADTRAESPPESELRLILCASALPEPEPQVQIYSASCRRIATADFAYERERVALFYDGGPHLEREQRDWDSDVTASLAEEGWRSMRITAGMLRDPRTLLRRIADLHERQGFPVAGYSDAHGGAA